MKTKLACFIFLAASVFAASAQTEVFREDFQRESKGGNWCVSKAGWSAFAGPLAEDISDADANTDSADFAAITNLPGNPSDQTGALFLRNDLTKNQTFAVVRTFEGLLELPPDGVFRWAMGNEDPEAMASVLIQVGGNGTVESGRWLASHATTRSEAKFSQFQEFSEADDDEVRQEVSFGKGGDGWEELALLPGKALERSDRPWKDHPIAAITGLGFYIECGPWLAKPVRIDSLVIESLP